MASSKGKGVLVAKDSSDSSDSEDSFVVASRNKLRHKGIVLEEPRVLKCGGLENDEYACVDEINMEEFCLMTGSAMKMAIPLSEDGSEAQDRASRAAVEELNRKCSLRLGEDLYTEVSSSSVALVSNSRSLPNKPQVTPKPTSLSTLELLKNNFDSKEEAFKYLVEFVDKNGVKVVQH